jgi:Rap1a immunity proteins
MRVFIVAGVLAAMPITASAVQTTAQEMLEVCSSGSNSPTYMLCQGYMAGFAQAAFGAQAQGAKLSGCLPDYFAGDELLALFKRYMLSATPKMKAAPIGPLLYVFLGTQYPCKQ